jgi:hypothetical protein
VVDPRYDGSGVKRQIHEIDPHPLH